MNIKIKTSILFLSVILLAVILTGCSAWHTFTDEPMLLIEASDWDNSGSTLKNLRIVDSEDEIIPIYSGTLELQKDNSDSNSESAGYVWLLEEGKSYIKIIWERDGVDQERTITINNAESGKIYYVRIS